jgi:hypothetical protein
MKRDLLKIILEMVNAPSSVVCRHLIALELVGLMEKHKMLKDDDIDFLTKNLISGCDGDVDAYGRLNKLIKE